MTPILEIIKIREPKESKAEGIYLMLEFKDIKTGKWYQTFLNPNYRNYNRWHKIAKVGNTIYFSSFKMENENTINADSFPRLMEGRHIWKEKSYDDHLKELAQSGTF